jgi:hypothetical protein
MCGKRFRIQREGRWLMSSVHVGLAAALELAVDGAGHHVARRQLGQR